MKEKKKPFYASKTSIYEWLYSIYGQKYCKYLKSKRYDPRKRKKKSKKSLIPNRIGIEKRSKKIDNRKEFGHCEADAIVSGKRTGSKESLIVSQERKSRFVQIRKVNSLKPDLFNSAILEMNKLVEMKSLTLDNGIENQYHEKLNIQTFFCDPYSSWQKGGVEHANGMIRRFIPKGCDISKYSDDYIGEIEDALNNKPRRCLNYKTPLEVMRENGLLLEDKKTPFRVMDNLERKIALGG